jgi:hypothetical protein
MRSLKSATPGSSTPSLCSCSIVANASPPHRHAIRHISLIRGFRPRQQFGHFGLHQLGLDLAGVFIGQRAVPAGIGVDFVRARLLPHPHEQRFDVLEKATPKRCDGVVVGMIVRGDEAERYRIVGGPLQLATRTVV